jgi:hypothetical protein
MLARSDGVRPAWPTCEHASDTRLDGTGCVPMAKARGQSRRAAKALFAINAGCGANELAWRRKQRAKDWCQASKLRWPNSPLEGCSFSASRFIRPADPWKCSPNGQAPHRCIHGCALGRCCDRHHIFGTIFDTKNGESHQPADLIQLMTRLEVCVLRYRVPMASG